MRLTTFGRLILVLAILGSAHLSAGAQTTPIISEFLASNNNGLEDEDGETSDWIEIYNPGTAAVDLGGWYLTDDRNDLRRWMFPAIHLAPKGFLVVFASGKNRAVAGEQLHTSFNLDAAGEYLALVQPDGRTVASEFSPVYPSQQPNISYGAAQEIQTRFLLTSNSALRVLIPTNGSLGNQWINPAFVDTGWRRGTNGVGYEASVPGFAVRNIKANIIVDTLAKAEGVTTTPSQQSRVIATNTAVINFLNTGDPGHYGSDQTFPGFSIGSDVEDFVVEATGTITIPAPGNWTFGVNSDDGFRLTVGGFTVAYADPRGPGDTMATFNFPTAGDYPLRLVYYERGGGAEVELWAAQGSYSLWNGSNFRLVGDVAQGGLLVRSTPLAGGSGLSFRPFIRTDVQAAMLGHASSAYLRWMFTNSTATPRESLWLQVKYDDGFVAYLNGQEVARRNAPATPAWDSLALMPRPNNLAVQTEYINLSDHLNLLQPGTNVLAIHGLNDARDGTDFLVSAELVENTATLLTNQYFVTPSPGTYNLSGFIAFVADTRFSRDRGFYDTPFLCEITTDTPGATIRYTLDGSTPTLNNGFTYTAPLLISNTTTLRAAGFRTGFEPSDVDTQTYIFANDVVQQSPAGQAPGPDWPAPRTSGGQVYDYGMDPDVVNHPQYRDTIRDDLKSLPTFSLVTDLKHLFDPSTGIYANPGGDEKTWERPCSLELIYPDGKDGFQENCGVRIRGGFSRDQSNPKHAFRFFFRQEYGAGRLRYPLFGSQGAQSFDKFDLRTMQNYSWAFQNDSRMICVRDLFSRDTQRDMGQPYTRGDFYHLYINGQYWGLFNIEERPEAAFGASYFGGAQEDYDVVKVDPDLGYLIEPTDGNLDAWLRLWQAATNGFASDAAYERVQGNNPDGTRNPAYENLVEVDNLIDYMLVILYGGNLDAPISQFLGNDSPNNFFTLRNRNGTAGFRFFAHDSEHTLLNVTEDRTGFASGQILADWTAGNPLTQGAATAATKSNPQYIWFQLQQNAEFRLRVADRVQKHFFNNGALTVEAARERMLTRSNELHRAIVAESARWGDAKGRTPPFMRSDWASAFNSVMTGFIAGRSSAVLNQLRTDGLYPNVSAPVMNQHGGSVPPGFNLYLTNSNGSGTIYFTLDGSDPRLRGGISSRAVAYAGPLTLNHHTQVRARARVGTTWSALVEATFFISQDFSVLQVTEIMYNPPPQAPYTSDDLEFLEFKNAGLVALDLSGVTFTAGLTFTFTNGTQLAPGGFFVLARNPAAFAAKYPGVAVNGSYTGQLANGGENLRLGHPLGGVILSFDYNDEAPWPLTADGLGYSLVPLQPDSNPNPTRGSNWRASAAVGGSPGADDPAPSIPVVYINEVLSHTDLPAVDAVELYNPNAFPVDLGGWFLTDDATWPKRYRIAEGTTIAAGGYLVFDETQFNTPPTDTNSFAFSSQGDAIYLFSGDANTNLTGYSHGFRFGAAAAQESFGRYVNSAGEEQWVPQAALTLGATNFGPRIGPVVIREIMYHPPDLPGNIDNQADEYALLFNLRETAVPFFDPANPTNTWRLRGGVEFNWPTNVTLAPTSALVVVSFDPADDLAAEAFRGRYPTLAELPLFGPYQGKFNNSSDRVELLRPDEPVQNTVPYVLVDAVEYRDAAPWPPAADGSGAVLAKLNAQAYGNDPGQWIAATPLTIETQPQSQTVKAGLTVQFSVSGFGEGPLRVQWYANSAAIPGATNFTLSLTDVTLDEKGIYRALVSDNRSSGWSAPARLELLFDPVVLEQPQSRTVAVGDTVSFTTVITNAATLPATYRWRRNGLSITNATFVTYEYSSTLTLTNVQAAQAGAYSVVVANSNRIGGWLSTNAFLTVVIPPTNQVVMPGTNVTFSVSAINPGSPARPANILYQWQFNGQDLPAATNTVLPLANVQPANAGLYSVVVSVLTNVTIAPATFSATLAIGEADEDGDGMPDAWESAHNLSPGNPGDASLDADGDGLTNLQEYLAGTDPRDAQSCLKLQAAIIEGGVELQFLAVSNRGYSVVFRDQLPTGDWSSLANLLPAPTNRTVVLTNTPALPQRFYRLVTPNAP